MSRRTGQNRKESLGLPGLRQRSFARRGADHEDPSQAAERRRAVWRSLDAALYLNRHRRLIRELPAKDPLRAHLERALGYGRLRTPGEPAVATAIRAARHILLINVLNAVEGRDHQFLELLAGRLRDKVGLPTAGLYAASFDPVAEAVLSEATGWGREGETIAQAVARMRDEITVSGVCARLRAKGVEASEDAVRKILRDLSGAPGKRGRPVNRK